MIKRLIFDLDNTLIVWDKSYISALKDTMEEYYVDLKYLDIINEVIEKMENKYEVLTRENLLEEINNTCNLNLELNFINKLIDNQKQLASYSSELVDTFKYLSNKYEIVLLTNWFKETQIARLEKTGILNYFNKIYGPEDTKLKPNKESFMLAGDNKPYECIMIGDNVNIDMKAFDYGFNVILVDIKNKYENIKYTKIDNVSKLKEML